MKQFIEKSKELYGKVLEEYIRDFPNNAETISTYTQWLGEILDVRKEDTDVTKQMVDHELKDWFNGIRSARTWIQQED